MKIVLESAEAVAAFSVALAGMGYKEHLEGIGDYDGEWVVILTTGNSVPFEVIQGITNAVNKKPWEKWDRPKEK
jgi:hypothetical protein